MRRLGRLLLGVAVLGGAAWGALALHYCGPGPAGLRDALAIGLPLTVVLLWVAGRWRRGARIGAAVLVLLVVAWWLAIPPRQDRDWQPDVAVLPWTEIDGDQVTVHAVRHNRYRTEQDYDVRHEDRRVSLAGLRTVDLFLSYWGPRAIAHTVMSFGFDDGQYLAFSIETRKEKGEEYSAVAGFFKQYEVTYVVADERDLIRLRTDVRGEEVYLYRLRNTPAVARGVFLGYLQQVNRLHDRPEWYNALTHNCTTAIRGHAQPPGARSWTGWKLLANGYLDELAYDLGAVDRSQPFAALREQSRINERARAARGDPDFSRRIRQGLPGGT